MNITFKDHIEMQPTTPAVDLALVAARAGLGLLVQHGTTHDELREAVFNGFRSHEEAEADGFNMSDGQQCILGRAIGEYTRGTELLWGYEGDDGPCQKINDLAVAHGFLVCRPFSYVDGDTLSPTQQAEFERAFASSKITPYTYGDLAQAWERILVPEWWAMPQTKVIRVQLDVIVGLDIPAHEVAANVRQHAEDVYEDVSIYTWNTNPVDEPDEF